MLPGRSPSDEASSVPDETAAAADPSAPRQLHPVAVAIVDREVARAAERRAILG
jgi:hypothetical protein